MQPRPRFGELTAESGPHFLDPVTSAFGALFSFSRLKEDQRDLSLEHIAFPAQSLHSRAKFLGKYIQGY